MKSLITYLLVSSFMLISATPAGNPGEQNNLTEEEKMALFIGHIYYLTNPLMELDNLVEFDLYILELSGETDVDALFSSNSVLIRSMRTAGQRMISTALQNFDMEGADRAYGRALEMGASGEQASQIRTNINSGSVDLYSYGQELLWLSRVLPSYVAGDETAFNDTRRTTETRRSIRQVLPLIESLGGDELRYYMNMFQDYIKYETALLVYYALYH